MFLLQSVKKLSKIFFKFRLEIFKCLQNKKLISDDSLELKCNWESVKDNKILNLDITDIWD